MKNRALSTNSVSTERMLLDNISLIFASMHGKVTVMGKNNDLVELDLVDWLKKQAAEERDQLSADDTMHFARVDDFGHALPRFLQDLHPEAIDWFSRLIEKIAPLVRDARYSTKEQVAEFLQKAEGWVQRFLGLLDDKRPEFTAFMVDYHASLTEVCHAWDRHKIGHNRAHQVSQAVPSFDAPEPEVDQKADEKEVVSKPQPLLLDPSVKAIERLVRLFTFLFPCSQYDAPYERNIARPFVQGVVDIAPHEMSSPGFVILEMRLYPEAFRLNARQLTNQLSTELATLNKAHRFCCSVGFDGMASRGKPLTVSLSGVDYAAVDAMYEQYRSEIDGSADQKKADQPKKAATTVNAKGSGPVTRSRRKRGADDQSSEIPATQKSEESSKKRKPSANPQTSSGRKKSKSALATAGTFAKNTKKGVARTQSIRPGQGGR